MLVTTCTSALAGNGGRRKNSHVTCKAGKTLSERAVSLVENRGQSRRVEIGAENDLCFIFHVASADASPRYLRTPFRTSPSRVTSNSSSRTLVHSSKLARQRPNVNSPRMDSHHFLSLSLSLLCFSAVLFARWSELPAITDGQLNQTLL